MAVPTAAQLIDQIGRLSDDHSIPRVASEGMSLDELRETMSAIRTALVEAVAAAPDSAFEAQPANAGDEDVWGAGQIVGHCNSAMFGIGSRALELAGIDAGEAPEALQRWSDVQVMTREEAGQAAGAVDVDGFYNLIPPGTDLEPASESDFFGAMPARAWLYFMAMHEADHVAQLRALSR